ARADRERRRLGGPETADPRDAFAAALDGLPLECIRDVLAQACRRIEKHVQAAEEQPVEIGIGAKRGEQQLEAAWHVEVRGGRYFAEVGDRRWKPRRRRSTGIDVNRAAVVEREAEVVVAAEGMVPRQPVAQHG